MPATSLIRLESPTDPTIGALAITFPSGVCKSLTWQSTTPIHDTLAMAKDLAARALQTCIAEDRRDDANRTNWPSVTAAAQAIVMQFNETRRAVVDNPPPALH